MTFRKILCPIDFSPGSRSAMAQAARLAREHGAELVLLHAWFLPVLSGEYMFPAAIGQELATAARRDLDAAVDEARGLGVATVTSRLINDAAPQAILAAAEADPGIDVIVIGTHGQSGLGRFVLGSVAEAVVRHAPRPVITIRHHLELRPFKNVLVPIDFSPRSREAMNLAAEVAQAGGGGITLIHVVELPVAWGELRPFDVDRELSHRAVAELKTWADELAGKTAVAVSTRVCVGNPGHQLLDVLGSELAFDLVVIGSHGRTGLARLALGSVAEKIIRHAPCAVLVTRHAK
ncbi:MAG TPA: universal stress protein [Kofleriaceae bacterium]|nr:universal stress protein [Kofleriaceae bacterium]